MVKEILFLLPIIVGGAIGLVLLQIESVGLFWHKVGVKRIVLARELSLEEIKEIRQKLPQTCEIEACERHAFYYADREGTLHKNIN